MEMRERRCRLVEAMASRIYRAWGPDGEDRDWATLDEHRRDIYREWVADSLLPAMHPFVKLTLETGFPMEGQYFQAVEVVVEKVPA